jgi:Flp pilus assembly protein TadB
MNIFAMKTWMAFYLVSFVTLLWAVFLTSSGIMLGISLILVCMVVGTNVTVVFMDVKRHHQRFDKVRDLHRDAVQVPARAGAGK